MPLKPGSSRKVISENIHELTHNGSKPRSHEQIVAISLHNADKYKHRAGGGGGLSLTPSFTEKAAQRDLSHDSFHPSGLFHSDVAGRTDRLPRTVPADSFVMPADAVGALGQGNTMAGAKLLNGITSGASGPYGTHITHPAGIKHAGAFGDGGAAHDGSTGVSKVMVAGGESLIHPTHLKNIGWRIRGGKKPDPKADLEAGHKWARDFVAKVRKQEIKRLKSAPPPKK